ncbi:Putative Lactate-responsive regulator, IclR family [Burkholderia sp. KJ006]|nr:Putative Lactate-responsive regulator, IclR family [Burkholderia sp. KJ006]
MAGKTNAGAHAVTGPPETRGSSNGVRFFHDTRYNRRNPLDASTDSPPIFPPI